MNLSGRLIDAFLALEETRRFAVAAERCHVSPSAFSQMISRLEEQVGARLFDRDTRNVALTPEGEVFSQGAHRIAAEMDASLHELRDRAQRNVGRISIAGPPSLAASLVAAADGQLSQDYPGIAMRLHDVVSDRCLEMVARGEVDFGLNAQRGDVLEFEAQLLFNEHLYLICPADDPLAQNKSVRMKDLRHHEFIHSLRSGSVWQQMLPMVTAAGIRDSGLEVTQFATMSGLIVNGFGISVVPQFAVELCRREGIAVVPVSDSKARRPIYMIKRKHRSLSVAAADMWARLAGAGKQLTTMPSPKPARPRKF